MRDLLSRFAIILSVLCAGLIAGCASSITPPTTVIVEDELVVAAWDENPKGPLWTQFALRAIDQHGSDLISMVPEDGDRWCKSYKVLSKQDRRAFWVYMISSLAKYESNYDPSVKFDETTVDKKMLTKDGKPIISRGLLQISKESANGYGCGIKDAEQLHDANMNISCTVRIVNRWVGKDKMISGRVGGKWKGAARYFSPFRDAKKLKAMQELSKAQFYCQ